MKPPSTPTVFLRGSCAYLRALRPEDLIETMPRFLSDRDVVRHLVRGTYPASPEEGRAEYDRLIGNRDEVQFAVCDIRDDCFVGVAGVHSLNWIARHAEFRILLGAKDRWGRGIGTETLRLVVAYGFELLNLNKVWLGVSTSNAAACRSYEKAGFVLEGRLRAEVYRNGRYFDVARFSLLREEYELIKKTWDIAPLLAEQL